MVSRETLLDLQLLTLELKLDVFIHDLERRYNPNWPSQPRVPGGEPIGSGQWTAGGGDFGGAVLVAANGSGYPVNLLDEEANGAHVTAEHVGASASYLKSRLLQMQTNAIAEGDSGDGLSVGSFTSLEAATKLVNSTLARNADEVSAVASGSLGGAQLDADFATVTGYEAYSVTERSQIYMRNTYRVRVVINYDKSSKNGFRIVTAFPFFN